MSNYKDSLIFKYGTLTPRQREVMGYMLEGQKSSDIAPKLCIQKVTVEYHVKMVLRKMGTPTTKILMYRWNEEINKVENKQGTNGQDTDQRDE